MDSANRGVIQILVRVKMTVRIIMGVRNLITNMHQESEESPGVRTGDDPTKAVLSESALSKKNLCDYVVNVATGCRHGCKFCYVPSTPAVRTRPEMLKNRANVDDAQKEWGKYVLYRDDLPKRLDSHLANKQTWKTSTKGGGVVGVSYSTDCYMDERAGDITRDVVEVLARHQKFTRVQTRNPILAAQDMGQFVDAGEFVTIGTSIPSFDSGAVSAIEPRAPNPELRLRGLKQFDEAGVDTFVSMSPTYPDLNKHDLRLQLEKIAKVNPSVIFHEPINPRGANFEMTIQAARSAGEEELATALESIQSRDEWVEYSVKHLRWVQELGEELGLPVHLWPDDQLIKHAPEKATSWLNKWKETPSPESFGKGQERILGDGSAPLFA